jgi:hypothetical protein
MAEVAMAQQRRDNRMIVEPAACSRHSRVSSSLDAQIRARASRTWAGLSRLIGSGWPEEVELAADPLRARPAAPPRLTSSSLQTAMLAISARQRIDIDVDTVQLKADHRYEYSRTRGRR